MRSLNRRANLIHENRLGWKGLPEKNDQAYLVSLSEMKKKSFITLAQGLSVVVPQLPTPSTNLRCSMTMRLSSW